MREEGLQRARVTRVRQHAARRRARRGRRRAPAAARGRDADGRARREGLGLPRRRRAADDARGEPGDGLRLGRVPEGERPRGRRRRGALLRRLPREPRLRARRPAGSRRRGRRLARPLRHERRLAPGQITEAVADAVGAFGTGVGIHAHNDGELAVANSLAAVAAGARQVQGTINGYGERTGNANLSSIVPNLVLKLGVECAAGEQLDRLTELSRYVDDVANVEPNRRLPFVGDAAFAHKGGIHVHAIAADPRTYEHLDPERGRQPAAHRRQRAERPQQRDRARCASSGSRSIRRRRRRRRSPRGSRSSRTRASSSRTRRRRSSCFCAERPTAIRAPFEALAYAVDSRKGRDDDGSTSTASAEVWRRRQVLRGEATGLGPVNASSRRSGERSPCLPAPRARRADRLPRHDPRATARDARPDPRPPHRHRARCRAVDDGRELVRPARTPPGSRSPTVSSTRS